MEDIQQQILNSDVIYSLTRVLPNPELISDVSDNDNDKTLTVPSNQIWEILWIWIKYIASATAGNRRLYITFRDNSNNTILWIKAKSNQIENKTEFYTVSPLGQIPDETIDDWHSLPIPPKLFLPAVYNIRINDVNNIDPSADNMHIRMMVNRFDV